MNYTFMRVFYHILFYAVLLGCTSLRAQDIFTYDEYMDWVQRKHPLAKVADLKSEQGEAVVLGARGGFDPKVQGSFAQKSFNDTRYYQIAQGDLKIPTWAGVTLDGGFMQNDGFYLNPENRSPNQGLVHAGLSVSVGQGLFIDQRRAELGKAELAFEMAGAERQLMLNELLLEAGRSYWMWSMSFHARKIYEEAMDLAKERYQAVVQSALLGDRPFIDTLEAGIQYQTRQLQFSEAELQLKNNALLLSTYLWAEGLTPLQLSDDAIPENLEIGSASSPDPLRMVQSRELIYRHPLLYASEQSIASARIDLRWKKEQLKPILDLKYNALTESIGQQQTNFGFNSEDYAIGLDFSMPIFLRKERSGLKLTKLKIQEKELELIDKQRVLELKLNSSLNDWVTSEIQARLFNTTVNDYRSLLEGERELFQVGESSLFMVNSRESSYIGANVKLLELLFKNRLSELKSRYALADLIKL